MAEMNGSLIDYVVVPAAQAREGGRFDFEDEQLASEYCGIAYFELHQAIADVVRRLSKTAFPVSIFV